MASTRATNDFSRVTHVVLASWMVLLGACQAVSTDQPTDEPLDSKVVANRLTEAHGGMENWLALNTVAIAREHRGVQGPTDFRFNILADYATQRIYERWEKPAGTVVWDGERAWSVDWPIAQRLTPRFVTSIGFFLVNMPWLVQNPQTRLLGVTRESGLPSNPEAMFVVLDIEFEAAPVRKPKGIVSPRDTFRLYIDPDTWLLAAVHQSRTHAGQLHNFGADASETAFVEIYVPTDSIEAEGLLWPGRYDIYAPTGVLTTRGRFFDYRFNVDIDEALFTPPKDAAGLVFDTSSSYQR
ncbi:MAG: hypothetical protein ACFHX7_12495 [Pseudomonadota bacterium]